MSLNAKHYSIQRQEDWEEDLYHLEIPTAWGALHNVWPGTDIINHWSIKPGDHKMCPLWIHLPAIYRFWPMSGQKAGLNKQRIPLEKDSSIRPRFFATLNCLQTLVPPLFFTIGEISRDENWKREEKTWCHAFHNQEKRNRNVLLSLTHILFTWYSKNPRASKLGTKTFMNKTSSKPCPWRRPSGWRQSRDDLPPRYTNCWLPRTTQPHLSPPASPTPLLAPKPGAASRCACYSGSSSPKKTCAVSFLK